MIHPLINQIRNEILKQMGTQLTEQQCDIIADFIGNSNRNTVIKVERTSLICDIDDEVTANILNMLTEIDILRREHSIICPECSLSVEKVDAADVTDDFHKEIFCYCCEKDVEVDASDVEVYYSLSEAALNDTSMLEVDKTRWRLESEKQKIINLTDLQRNISEEIATATKNLPQLKCEYEEALENFILEYMREKFGIKNLHDGNRSYLIFDKAAQFIKVYRLKQDFEYMDGKDGMTAALKNERLYGHCAASWFSRVRDFYDLDLREQLKILDWTFDDAGNVVDADW